MDNSYIIIVAAGTGRRFGSDIPKQFLPLGKDKKPILFHTINAFLSAGIALTRICVVLNRDYVDYWKELCRRYDFVSPQVCEGGETRFHSVQNAVNFLQPLNSRSKVLVHDGARPLVSKKIIESVITKLEVSEAVVPSISLKDSLRVINSSGSNEAVDRSRFRAVQTPQGFNASVLTKAYRQSYLPSFTDDASVVESLGYNITLVEGENENIKITNQQDLIITEALLNSHQ